MLSPTTHAQSGAPTAAVEPAATPQPHSPPSKSEQQRLGELEQKIYQAARYIEGLHRELQLIKRSAGVVTPPVGSAAPATPQPSSPPPGTQHAYRGSTPQEDAAARERRRRELERIEEQEQVSQEQEQPELQSGFLVQANAVLIPRGRFDFEPSLSFRHSDQNQLRVFGTDVLDAIFVGEIDVRRLRRNVLRNSYALRYGLTDRIQLNAVIPYQRTWRKVVLEPDLQHQLGESAETSSSDGGLGDITAGVSIHLLQEGEWLPDVIWTTSLKSDTGTSPFDVDSGSLATGTGFWGLRSGFTLLKVSDPAVLFLSAGYFYHHKSDDVRGFDKVDPPDSVDLGMGMAYALNPFLSITTRFAGSFTEKTQVNGLEIDGSDSVSAALGLGVTYAISNRTSLDISAEFGLTEDAPDFTLRVSTPMSFSLPRFWADWRSWRLSRLFRF